MDITSHRGPLRRASSRPRLIYAGCALMALCVVCLLVGGALSLYLFEDSLLQQLTSSPTTAVAVESASATPTIPSPTPNETLTASPTAPPAPLNPLASDALPTALARDTTDAKPALELHPPASIVQAPAAGQQHLQALLLADYPIHDFFEAGQRLGGQNLGPRTVSAPAFQLGDRQTFFVDEANAEATLLAVTEHAYFWAEDSLNLDRAAVEATALRFEEEYYPRLVHLFGQEWQPGVDNDPHFSVLHLDYIDSETDELGHFNSGDEYPRAFFNNSNQQELVYLNMSNLTLGSDLYFGTLVHEFQHLVQWYVDGNETTWLNEGLSQLAEIYVGLETADTVDYLLAPDTQLTAWNYSDDGVFAHYAAAYLFCVYLWEQLGDAAIQELARHPANGIASVDAVLKGFRPELSLEHFMADWAVATYLDNSAPGAQYHYQSLDFRQAVSESGIKFTPQELLQAVEPFGVHYVDLDVQGATTISFVADTTTRFLPTTPYSGEQVWFAPAQETVNAQLSRRFDLAGLEGATLTFWTWYDLEYDLDYGYVSVSADDGETWEVLDLTNGAPGEYGSSLNGRSESRGGAGKAGWVQESVSLDAYAGRSILIRFELLTYYDSGAHGLALDDIAVPELNYLDDAESDGVADGGGWQAAGFVRVGSQLPQTWGVRLIHKGTSPRVVALDLDEFNQGQWTVELGPEGAVLAIMPVTPFATEAANYWLFVEK